MRMLLAITEDDQRGSTYLYLLFEYLIFRKLFQLLVMSAFAKNLLYHLRIMLYCCSIDHDALL